MNMRYLIPFILFALLILFLWKGLDRDPHHLESALLNKPLPHFVSDDLLNPQEKISEQSLKGKVSLLNVWATWCAACDDEHEFLMQLASQHNIPIYGLNYKDSPEAARQWLHERGNPFVRIISDPQGTLGINLGVYGAPETFILDAQGVVRFRYVGSITPKSWEEKMMPVIQRWSHSQ